jgi:DNA processing protein
MTAPTTDQEPMVGHGELPEAAWWAAAAGLPGMGPVRLGALWDACSGEEAWRLLAGGRAHQLPTLAVLLGREVRTASAALGRAADAVDVAERWAAHEEAGVTVLVRGDARMPARLADDIDPPFVLFATGDLGAIEGPTVAVVGTRRCSRAGAEMAHDIGRRCARAGARVVSGLAVGIDAAAHAGALAGGPGSAPPVAVVGSGLDVVYPARSRTLWHQVAARGVVLSEYPLGTSPSRWRFPARNRLVAALADVVVVVESGRTGGSMYTVDEALARQRDVLAVPGSVRSPASVGTNWLLSQGAQPCCSTEDVLVAAGLSPAPDETASVLDPRPPPTGDGRRVLRAIGWDPTTLDAVARRTGLGLGALALAVDGLEADGWIDRSAGRIERRATP